MSGRVDILGVKVDALTISQATVRITELARQPGAYYVSKPYVEFMEAARDDPSILKLLNEAALVLPDGVALQWAAAYATGRRGVWPLVRSLAEIVTKPNSVTAVLPERFAGVDATWQLLERCEQEGLRVFLIGSPQGSQITGTAEAIQGRLPGLAIAGTAPGEIGGLRGGKLYRALAAGKLDISALAKNIVESRADVILTGIGFPQQEALNAALAKQLSHGVLIGEGGSFDFDSFGGRRKRAPRILRRSGLEWLWRLMPEPRRLRRQLAIPRFIWHIYRAYR